MVPWFYLSILENMPYFNIFLCFNFFLHLDNSKSKSFRDEEDMGVDSLKGSSKLFMIPVPFHDGIPLMGVHAIRPSSLRILSSWKLCSICDRL